MSGMIERLRGRPPLPDLFGRVEAGFPGIRTAPGLHGIRVEEHLADGTYVLRAELPGIDPSKDVEITVTEGVLTLRAERAEEAMEKHHTEFRYGTFARAIRLPAGAKGDKATADYKDGVLAITVRRLLLTSPRDCRIFGTWSSGRGGKAACLVRSTGESVGKARVHLEGVGQIGQAQQPQNARAAGHEAKPPAPDPHAVPGAAQCGQTTAVDERYGSQVQHQLGTRSGGQDIETHRQGCRGQNVDLAAQPYDSDVADDACAQAKHWL